MYSILKIIQNLFCPAKDPNQIDAKTYNSIVKHLRIVLTLAIGQYDICMEYIENRLVESVLQQDNLLVAHISAAMWMVISR